MAYDAATHNVVLFGGLNKRGLLRDTWVWDGSTWTKQDPATRPPAREYASMAYDAATGNVVLFGGFTGRWLADTWVWNGSTWTKQHPATRPPAHAWASMAYDAATGNVVLFGGVILRQSFADTWVWDGSTWTKQHPATSPPARSGASMAYDAATGNLVLFGGAPQGGSGLLSDTWAWDGSTWTEQHPATSPPGRGYASMAYDTATGNLVLFGGWLGIVHGPIFADTWVWGSSS